MRYFLDTNICIHALKGQYPAIKNHLLSKKPSDIAIPAIVHAELYYGALKSSAKSKVLEALKTFLDPFEIIAFNSSCSLVYAEIRADLEKRGAVIGPNDLIIAATALAYNAVLVTANTKEFLRVKKLVVEDWTE